MVDVPLEPYASSDVRSAYRVRKPQRTDRYNRPPMLRSLYSSVLDDRSSTDRYYQRPIHSEIITYLRSLPSIWYPSHNPSVSQGSSSCMESSTLLTSLPLNSACPYSDTHCNHHLLSHCNHRARPQDWQTRI